jgi:peptide methionine sulfoxide reductase MsrA|tara:strand:+ start:579 stop:725 length:147 start_codon:yes stop_codon:yes gene_type:complete
MDSGIQYRQLIQSLHQHQGEMQKIIIEQEQEIKKLQKLIVELEAKIDE